MINWDDTRFVLALARSGSIRAAAKTLVVNHTTVSRRISALEKQLSARLFERTPSGFVLTASGKVVSQAAEEMENLILGSQARIEGADRELKGEIHIQIPDIFDFWVCEHISQFSIKHPELDIHLDSVTDLADLSRREADLVLRFSESPPEDMVGQKVCRMPIAVYAGIDHFHTLKQLPNIAGEVDDIMLPEGYPWIRWAKRFANTPVERWTERVSQTSTNVTRVNSYQTLTNLIRNGAGIGCLCPWFADNDAGLRRLTPFVGEAAMDVWVLIHPDLRGVRRIKAIKDLFIGIFQGNPNLSLANSCT